MLRHVRKRYGSRLRRRLVVNSIPLAIEAAARAFLEITKMHLDCLHGQAAATRD